jgi:hypothetical protein
MLRRRGRRSKGENNCEDTDKAISSNRSWICKPSDACVWMELHGDRPRLGLPLDTVAIPSSSQVRRVSAAGSACNISRTSYLDNGGISKLGSEDMAHQECDDS